MIIIKNPEEIAIMQENGKILAKILKEVEKQVKPGITTDYLNKVAEDLVFRYKVKPSFKGYKGFPAALCTSINEVIVHGLPSDRKLKQGDIISLDLGILYKGFHADMAITLAVGKVTPEVSRMIKATKKALKRGIAAIKPGKTLGDVGRAIEHYVESQGFKVVRELCGHGIGRELHEDPEVLNYGSRGKGPKLTEGMVLALEPMVTMGDWEIKKSQDNFGYETRDSSLSCHFEHTVVVTKKGPIVLTE